MENAFENMYCFRYIFEDYCRVVQLLGLPQAGMHLFGALCKNTQSAVKYCIRAQYNLSKIFMFIEHLILIHPVFFALLVALLRNRPPLLLAGRFTLSTAKAAVADGLPYGIKPWQLADFQNPGQCGYFANSPDRHESPNSILYQTVCA